MIVYQTGLNYMVFCTIIGIILSCQMPRGRPVYAPAWYVVVSCRKRALPNGKAIHYLLGLSILEIYTFSTKPSGTIIQNSRAARRVLEIVRIVVNKKARIPTLLSIQLSQPPQYSSICFLSHSHISLSFHDRQGSTSAILASWCSSCEFGAIMIGTSKSRDHVSSSRPSSEKGSGSRAAIARVRASAGYSSASGSGSGSTTAS